MSSGKCAVDTPLQTPSHIHAQVPGSDFSIAVGLFGLSALSAAVCSIPLWPSIRVRDKWRKARTGVSAAPRGAAVVAAAPAVVPVAEEEGEVAAAGVAAAEPVVLRMDAVEKFLNQF